MSDDTQTESAPPPAAEEPHGAPSVAAVEKKIDDAAGRVWSMFQRHPVLGSLVGAGALLTAAAVYGASEAAVAAVGGYMVYRAIRRRRGAARVEGPSAA